jgi:putative DNA primase/helicase
MNGNHKREYLALARLIVGRPSSIPDTEPYRTIWGAVKTAPPPKRVAALREKVVELGLDEKEILYAVFAADPGDEEPEVVCADHPCTDTGNAETMAVMFGDKLRYDHRRKRWLIWDGGKWRMDGNGNIQRMCIQTVRQRYKTAADIDDEKQRQRAIAWALQSESKGRLTAMESIAQSLHPIANSGEEWDADQWLLGCENGVIDLRTGGLRPSQQSDNITMTTPIAYDPDAAAPRWERFLEEVFSGNQELIDFIRRAAGYSLTGDTREQCLFLCYGAGANGKSTLLESLRMIAGDLSANTPFSTFEQRSGESASNDIAALYGKRLVTASETNEARRLNEARAKAVTGGDPVTARFLFGEYFTYTPTYKIWLAMNHKPTIIGSDDGIWRRIRLIPFNVSFKGRADKKLAATLKDEAPGILAWAVRGCLEWQAAGLAEPQEVVAATNEYRIENDIVAQFVEAVCTRNQNGQVKGGDLYAAYKQWAVDNGDAPMTNTAFGRRIKQQEGITAERITGNVWYFGIQIKDSYGLKDS